MKSTLPKESAEVKLRDVNLDAALVDVAARNLGVLLSEAFDHHEANGHKALVVYDQDCALSRLLTRAYRKVLPAATFIDFAQNEARTIRSLISELQARDLVILVQSTSFRLDEFRIRVHLFEQGLKVIEHPHLSRLSQSEIPTYIEALSYDASYYRRVGPALKSRLDQALTVTVTSGAHRLKYQGPFEPAKLNIGDYRGMKNTGGQFPIGEVFTELKDLKNVNGTVEIFAFGDRQFSVRQADPPILLEIEAGRIIRTHHACAEFSAILEDIRAHEGEIWVRELGFGLNRAMTREVYVHDVGIYERMCGLHLSLGAKHALYPKEGFHKKKVKFHVDVFAVVDHAAIDEKIIYQKDHYVL